MYMYIYIYHDAADLVDQICWFLGHVGGQTLKWEVPKFINMGFLYTSKVTQSSTLEHPKWELPPLNRKKTIEKAISKPRNES